MKKYFVKAVYATAVVCLLSINSYSQSVLVSKVLIIAENVYKSDIGIKPKIKELIPFIVNSDTCLYIVNFESKGFAIIGGHYGAEPLYGFCRNTCFNIETVPGGLEFLINKHVDNISRIFSDTAKASLLQLSLWASAVDGTLFNGPESKSAGDRLLPIDIYWHQGSTKQTGDYDLLQSETFNRDCPTGCLAGCNAVAMAQVLYYWKWDVDQTGSNTYDGLTVNFGLSNYCYDYMEPNMSGVWNSRLIYHAGVSCNTNYCANSSGGSSAYINDVRDGFCDFWGMSSNAKVTRRLWIMFPSWKSRLISDLDYGRPIVYGGGNHTWVIDGYNSLDQFYCLWGNSSTNYYDGYYSLGNFNPGGSNYNYPESAIFELYPEHQVAYEVSGPEILTSAPTTFTLLNKADCKNAEWSCTSNIEFTYGGQDFREAKAISGGIGWIDVRYVIDGVIYNAPRKYVTCQVSQ